MRTKYIVAFLIIALLLSTNACAQKAAVTANSEPVISSALPIADGITNVRQMYAGNGYSMMIKNDGSLWSWGRNSNFRLGTGKYSGSTTPVKIADCVKMAALSEATAYALKEDGTLLAWGYAKLLNPGSTEDIKLPISIENEVVSVKASASVVMFLKSDGTLYGFGTNRVPILGEDEIYDKPVKLFTGVKDYWCASTFALLLKEDNTLWGWGSDQLGQLQGGATEVVSEPNGNNHTVYKTPVKLMDKVMTAAVGNGYVAVVDSLGGLYTWGENNAGQLGNGGLGQWYDKQYGGKYLKSPVPTKILSDIERVYAGDGTTAALSKDGTLWMFGSNLYGKIGDGTTINAATPVKILDGVAGLSISQTHVFAQMKDASVMAWGSNQNGEFGTGYSTTIKEPIEILKDIKSVSTYNEYTLAVSKDSALYAFGDNEFGQLGDGTMLPTSVPKIVMTDVQQSAAGQVHSMALLNNDKLLAWGSNGSGQLGNGKQDEVYSGLKYQENGQFILVDYQGNKVYVSEKNVHQPEVVMTDIISIAAELNTSYALKNNGDLFGFGWDELNQLGDDLRNNSVVPKLITTGIKAISPPYSAITENDKLIYWGYTIDGFGYRTPTVVMDNIKKVVSNNYDLVLTGDNILQIVGMLPYHLSNPDSPSKAETPMDLVKNIIDFDANENNLFVLDANQTLYAAKYNDIVLKTDAEAISGILETAEVYKVMEHVSAVAAGLHHVLFITNDGTLYGYGDNNMGQLGDGNRLFVPQKIST